MLNKPYGTVIALAAVLLLAATLHAQTFPGPSEWGLNNNVAFYWIPWLIPYTSTMQVPVQIRTVGYLADAWFEAWAPFDPEGKAVGRIVMGNVTRARRLLRTTRNKNIAISYATYLCMTDLFPTLAAKAWFDQALTNLGLPTPSAGFSTLNATDRFAANTGVNVGNMLREFHHTDGFNQVGTEGGHTAIPQPYFDYTGYSPINTAEQLNNPDRWQPDVVYDSKGLFFTQHFTTPQFGLIKTFAVDVKNSSVAPQRDLFAKNHSAYLDKVDHLIAEQLLLDDYRKMATEFFDMKLVSLDYLNRHLAGNQVNNVDYYIPFNYLLNQAITDAAALCWYHKAREDAIRPDSAIHFVKRNQKIRGYAGPEKGFVEMKGTEWKSYLYTNSFPEYPSGTTCLCAAFGQAARRFKGSDALNFTITFAPGSSVTEPGVSPAQSVTLGPYPTITDAMHECGLSRVWAGVHFEQGVEEAHNLCKPAGDIVYERFVRLMAGDAS